MQNCENKGFHVFFLAKSQSSPRKPEKPGVTLWYTRTSASGIIFHISCTNVLQLINTNIILKPTKKKQFFWNSQICFHRNTVMLWKPTPYFKSTIHQHGVRRSNVYSLVRRDRFFWPLVAFWSFIEWPFCRLTFCRLTVCRLAVCRLTLCWYFLYKKNIFLILMERWTKV